MSRISQSTVYLRPMKRSGASSTAAVRTSISSVNGMYLLLAPSCPSLPESVQ